MPFDITPYAAAIAVGGTASEITGNLSDSVPAGAYAAWINSITGSVPQVIATPDKRARLVLSKEQSIRMQAWLDSQVGSALSKPKILPRVQIELGPALGPWAIKYAVPLIVGSALAGWILHWYIGGR